MKTLVLYGSTHGSTRWVVEKLSEYLAFPFDVRNAAGLTEDGFLQDYQLLLLFSPTYGDEEMQEGMEQFLVSCKCDLSGKFYSLCELGNYYGYDDFTYGARAIMEYHMQQLGAKEMVSSLSLDSLPKKDWAALERWCGLLNNAYREGQSAHA